MAVAGSVDRYFERLTGGGSGSKPSVRDRTAGAAAGEAGGGRRLRAADGGSGGRQSSPEILELELRCTKLNEKRTR